MSRSVTIGTDGGRVTGGDWPLGKEGVMFRHSRRRSGGGGEQPFDPEPGVRVLASREDLDGAIARAVSQERAAARHVQARIARYDAMTVPTSSRLRTARSAAGLGPLLGGGE